MPQPQAVAGRGELFVALRKWVEKGDAPGRIDVSLANGSVTMPICVYPKQAQRDGIGDPGVASSYQCR